MITLTSTSYSVTLPNPTFGNTIRSNVQLAVRRTLSNKQRTIVTSSTEREFNLTIDQITITQKAELGQVLSESDEIMEYTDMNNEVWDGYITNFPFDINETYTRIRTDEQKAASEDGGDIERRYSCTINFRGQMNE